ncbi:SCO family protein [Thiomicrorhabdus heinhorstiae]|uniref:SCO family protein n=1 Tax=Thiomicrorhabdus heinhorstiae TaxID=2748010 RepID=A0ABS0BZG4_9GAMM|nr:SCO family protein [Thiomicrorhabdus heinhorstiae]MBF6058251.1 SCO family protein [Thiomicrorhabdus heinhorstiae]
MKLRTLIYVLLALAIGATIVFWPGSQNSTHKMPIVTSEKPQGGDFTLQAADGSHKLSDYRGKLVLIYFGYTFCPDICPTNLGNLSVAYHQLSDEQKRKLQILFVSVDPHRDTPKRLQQYADYFESNIVGLTGDPQTIAEIARRYGVVYAKVEDDRNPENYAVDHSAFTYVVDANGKLQTQLPHATSPQQFINAIEQYQKDIP